MNLVDEALTYLEEFTQKVATTGIDVSNYNLDHVAYQASSTEDYEKRKPMFEEVSNYMHETIVGGRRVSVFRLKTQVSYKGNTILALELIEPTNTQKCQSAWEHAEYALNEDYKNLVDRYPHLNWDTHSISRNIYSHLKLRLDDKTQLKFHLHDILETIKLEEKDKG